MARRFTIELQIEFEEIPLDDKNNVAEIDYVDQIDSVANEIAYQLTEAKNIKKVTVKKIIQEG